MKKIQRKKIGKASVFIHRHRGWGTGGGKSTSTDLILFSSSSSSVLIRHRRTPRGFSSPLFCVHSAVVAKMLSLCRRRRRIMLEEEEEEQQQEEKKQRGRLVAQGKGSC